jgi:succinate-semialdehyde dehydrogenase/glutarate-semialdehyde dehydrogenase
VCHAIADLIEERREEMARELSLEQGKPYTAEALPDIDETAENFRIAAEDVKRMETAIIPSQDVNKRILTSASRTASTRGSLRGTSRR